MPRVIMFDLGGVLVETGGMRELATLIPDTIELEPMLRRWNASPAMVRYEAGACSRDEFARDFVAEFDLALEPAEFLAFFANWLKPTFPGSLALLASLKERFTLACLSNTNELHWEIMLARDDLLRSFHWCFASHHVGLRKPGPEIYRHAADALRCQPSEIVFFDDREDNVAGARAIGIRAHRVEGPAALTRAIADLQLT